MSDVILIVEDDPDIRNDLAEVLQEEGYRVVTAHHGGEAMERLQEIPPPCLIVLDLMMPVMDGWTFRSEILKDPQLKDVPIIVLSGVADFHTEARVLDAVAYVTKPFKLDGILREIGRYCSCWTC